MSRNGWHQDNDRKWSNGGGGYGRSNDDGSGSRYGDRHGFEARSGGGGGGWRKPYDDRNGGFGDRGDFGGGHRGYANDAGSSSSSNYGRFEKRDERPPVGRYQKSNDDDYNYDSHRQDKWQPREDYSKRRDGGAGGGYGGSSSSYWSKSG